MIPTNNVLSEDFDMTRIIGKDLRTVAADRSIEWASAYPIIDDGFEITGIVDGNYPHSFNGGDWKIFEDTFRVGDDNVWVSYAVAFAEETPNV